jgi:ketosteroid isomerase-like protein
MKTKIFFLLLVAILGTSACTQKPVTVNNDALIDSLLSDCSNLWNSGNPETALSWYADDAIIIFNDATYSGRDSILAFCKRVVPNMKNMKAYRGTFAIVNDLITGTGMYSFDWVGPDQQLYPIRGSAILYWQKTADNKWKIIMQVCQQADVVKK